MRNYLKYLSDTIYLFQRKYSLTDNQLKFLLFINDEKGSFTKRFIKENVKDLKIVMGGDNNMSKLVLIPRKKYAQYFGVDTIKKTYWDDKK